MIVVPIKEGENIEKALKKLKRKFEKTGVVKEENNEETENKLFEPKDNKENKENKEDENVLLTVQQEKKKTIKKKWIFIIRNFILYKN